ncbi:MAG: hypothetical protein GKR89_11790 [Candidatus Latescibacteria bacterium]|nr:hypothetical protein [Candidatus Latescibacterota bacterium]
MVASCRLLAALLVGIMSVPVSGLTVYRLGGEGVPPPPEVTEGGAEFVQFSWADLDSDLQGTGASLTIEPGGISPLFITEDQNLVETVWERGGFVNTGGGTCGTCPGWVEADETFIVSDGDLATAYFEEKGSEPVFVGGQRYGKSFLIDLGGLFAVDRIRFSTRAGNEANYIEHFYIWTNALTNDEASISNVDLCGGGRTDNCLGFVGRDHRLLWTHLALYFQPFLEVKENILSRVEVELPGEYIRRVNLHVPSQRFRDWEVAEIEIFAPGYVPGASYTSNILDLGQEVTLGALRWSGDKDAAAKVDIRSQSGSDTDPNIYWRKTFRGDEQVVYDTDGDPLTLRTFRRLEPSERGKITRDAENWDFWSTNYDFADSTGVKLAATEPRRYVQFEMDFASEIDAGGRLEYLEWTASPPAVTVLVGEIDPWQAPTAEVTQFTYAIRATVGLDDPGFDHVEITATGGRLVGLDAVRVGGEEVAFTRVEEGPDRLVVGVPKIDIDRTEEVVEVDFSGEIFRFGATFAGHVFNSETPGDIQQPVQVGDATALRDGNTLSVQSLSLGSEILSALDLGASAFTPNGDGVNDGLDISYDLLKLASPTPVVLEVRDLSGRLVREVYNGQDVAGRHVRRWNGLDEAGQPVRPGIYICRVEAETEEGRQQRSGVVAVAY